MLNRISRPVQAIIINAILFTVLLVFTNPIFETTEDVTILYMLSGGFGAPPTELVHYNHILHPFLSIIIKSLFVIAGQVNWYSVFLLLGHYAACTIILALLLQKKPQLLLLPGYVLLFAVFECKLLVTVNFTNTSIVLGCAACALLYSATREEKLNRRKVAWGMIVLLAASFFRIHVLIPVAGITLPFFYLQIQPRKSIAISAALAVTAVLIFLANQFQQFYYKANIPGWQQQEAYRQQVFRFYNDHNLHVPRPGEKWYNEYQLIITGLAIDTNYLSSSKLNIMHADLKKNKQPAVTDPDVRYWFLVNNRLLFISIIFLLLALPLKRKFIISFFASMVLLTAGLLYLNQTAKIPYYLLTSCLFLGGIFIILSAEPVFTMNRYLRKAKTAGVLLLLFWGIVRIYKLNRTIEESTSTFRNAYAETAKKKDTLFLISGELIPIQYFSVFDSPQDYPLTNWLYNEQFLCNIHQPILARYRIDSIRQLPYKTNVLFWGLRTDDLESYFRQVTKDTIRLSPSLMKLQHGAIFSVSTRTKGQ